MRKEASAKSLKEFVCRQKVLGWRGRQAWTDSAGVTPATMQGNCISRAGRATALQVFPIVDRRGIQNSWLVHLRSNIIVPNYDGVTGVI